MLRTIYIIAALLCGIQVSYSQNSDLTNSEKQRLIVLADMGNEPDEIQQIIHLVMCSNEFDVEGLIAVTGIFLHPESDLGEYNRLTHPELFLNIIDAYQKVFNNLKIHASGWPEPDALRKVVTAGQKGYGINDVGEGKTSAGSELIIKAVTNGDSRPLWIVVNAGSNTLAQAIFDYHKNHSKSETDQFIAKLRVFENGSQDNAGAWICSKYPNIHWIRSNYQTYAYGEPGGNGEDLESNLGPNFWQPYENSTLGQLNWLKENVMNNHGALGNIYPERRYHAWPDGMLGFMEGGGTIPWIGLVNKGLFDINHPSWGGWGGRFSKQKTANFWSRHSAIKADELQHAPFYMYSEESDDWVNPEDGKDYSGNYAPVWRWRKAMYNDLVCRMDWCTKSYKEANHQPVAVFNGDKSNAIIHLKANIGETILLNASASFDADGDKLVYSWFVYREAGTYAESISIPAASSASTTITIPNGAEGKQIHVILEIHDDNKIASLFDYRRIVIDVKEAKRMNN